MASARAIPVCGDGAVSLARSLARRSAASSARRTVENAASSSPTRSGPVPSPIAWGMRRTRSSTKTLPSVGASSAVISCRSVDLPTPLAPTSATWRPLGTRNDTSEKISSPPGWAYATPFTSITGTPPPCQRGGRSTDPPAALLFARRAVDQSQLRLLDGKPVSVVVVVLGRAGHGNGFAFDERAPAGDVLLLDVVGSGG